MPDILCTICARGGSKGVEDKNIREIAGKPMIAHTIDDAKQWKRDVDLVVSTDSEKIASAAREHGGHVPFMRPKELASDESPKLPAIKHAVREMEKEMSEEYDYVVDLGVTTPLRVPQDIEQCFQTVASNEETSNAYTVCKAERNPYFNMVELSNEQYAELCKTPDSDIERRQDTPEVYEMNASVYVYRRDFLMETESVHGDKTRISEMPRRRSVDIDSKLDLEIARCLAERE